MADMEALGRFFVSSSSFLFAAPLIFVLRISAAVTENV